MTSNPILQEWKVNVSTTLDKRQTPTFTQIFILHRVLQCH